MNHDDEVVEKPSDLYDDNFVVEKADLQTIETLSRFLEGTNGYIAGGVFKHLYETPGYDGLCRAKDIDLFYRNEEDFKQAKKLYESKFEKIYSSANSSGFRVPLHNGLMLNIDLVAFMYGEPKEIIKRFDYTIVQQAMYFENGEYYVLKHKNTDEHLKNKTLAYWTKEIPSKQGIIERLQRYISYDFNPSIETATEAIQQFCDNKPELAGIQANTIIDTVAEQYENAAANVTGRHRGTEVINYIHAIGYTGIGSKGFYGSFISRNQQEKQHIQALLTLQEDSKMGSSLEF